MGVALWISPALQFGGLAPGDARQSALRQAVAQAVRGHLFAETAPGSEADSPYLRALLSFSEVLSAGFTAERAGAQTLWAGLVPADELAAAAQAEEVPEQIEGAFCLSVQALCAALAIDWVGAPDSRGETETDDEGAEDSEEAAESAGGEWRADYPRVVGALVALLRQATWRWVRDRGLEGVGTNEDLRLIATLLLDTLLGTLGDWFTVETVEWDADDGQRRTRREVVLRQPELGGRIGRLLAELPFRFTLHPLKEPVAYRLSDRGPPDGDDTEYFRIDLIGYRRSNGFLRRLHAGATALGHCAPEFQRYVDAVNIQQAVPWRLNLGILHWARCLVAVGGGGSEGHEGEPPEVAGLDPDARANLVQWVREGFYRPPGTGTRKAIERPGEFLDSPLASAVIKDLCQEGPDGQPVAFYLPWKADYRGRIYAETPWLTPQGGDLQRALFEFARGRPLDEAGVRALRRHGANLVRRSRLLQDLGIDDRQVATLDERERWVVAHEPEILASAASPLREPFWRTVAGKPMQFLAFCLAYRQWTLEPSVPVHLPVQIDGTCNGLQHIAALTGDAGLARAVNVLIREGGLPGDIYSELAVSAVGNLGQLGVGLEKDPNAMGLALADAWLAASSTRRAWLNRETAKKVVMTVPYGASRGAQAHHILEAITNNFEGEWRQDAPPLSKLDELVAWKDEDKKRRVFVARCTRGAFGKPPKAAFSGADELSTLLAGQEWERRRTFAAYVALALVRHLHDALSATYPSVNAFSLWLRKTAKACEGLPLLWQTPLGFPVCQDKFKLRRTSASGRLGTERVRIDVLRLDEAVAPSKQGSALLPNLIHSLDATHLAMTLLEANAGGVVDVGSIHDCLLCHPNDAVALGLAVRKTFARLYRTGVNGWPEVLTDWSGWMQGIARINALRSPATVLGALDHPDGLGERTLAAFASDEGEEGAAARDALTVIEELRRLSAPRLFLMRRLLELMRDGPERQEEQKGRKPAPKPAPDFVPTGDFALSERSLLSEYFFS